MKKRLQNKVAEGKFALPVVSVYAALACLAAGFWQQELWPQLAALTLSAYLMVELNNRNVLIRIYSRMVSCSFLMLSVMAAFLMPSLPGAVVQICFITFYLLLFQAYQDRRASGSVFYAFAALGMASMVFVQILYFVPLFWLLMLFNIYTFSGRTFSASLLGLLLPYWFVGAYDMFNGDYAHLPEHFGRLGDFGPFFDISQMDVHRVVTILFVALLAITGSVHFLRNSYQDKIRTRLLYEIFILIDVCTLLFLILQPQYCDFLLGIMIVNTAPLVGHFLALTSTRVTNIAFFVILLSTLVLTAYNLWI